MDNQPHHIIENCPVCHHQGQYVFTGKDLLHGLPGEFVYAKCESCGVVYQCPMPGLEKIASFYPEQYDPYRPKVGKEKNPLEKSVLRSTYGFHHLHSILPDWFGKLMGKFAYKDSIPFTSGGRLLDIGCGGGKFLLSMKKLGWESEGVEFNQSACETCRQLGLKVFHGELAETGIADESFHVVTARHVIEHIPEPLSFVAEIFRILKPGGLMVLKTPNSRALARNWFGTNWFPNEVPRHLVLYSPSNLRLLAEKQGFSEKRVLTSSSPKCFLNSWDYLTNNKGIPSRKQKIRRMLSRLYVMAASLTGRGDEINAIFKKPALSSK